MIKPGSLKPFMPFTELPPEYVIIAASFAEQITLEDKEILIDSNSEDTNDYFLLDGKLASEDVYGAVTVIESGAVEAAKPLPQLRPSAYRIVAHSGARVIKVPQEVIRRVRAEAPEKDLSIVDDITLDVTQTREFFNDFKEELQMNRVRLPSLAHSASRVHRLLGGEKVSEADLIAAIAMDPAISAKLLKMANSTLFNLEDKVQHLSGIVSRLGVYSTREIAACFAFRDVYKNSPPELVKLLEEQVVEARQVSAIAEATAEITGNFDPQIAAMGGLLHNVGVLPIFSYSMQNVAYSMNPKLVIRAIEKIAPKAGALLAKKWRFSEEIVQSIEHSHDWSYENKDGPDLVNIVLMAKYHYFLSRSGMKMIPKARDVPSIRAATRGKFDQDLSLQILGRARELIKRDVASKRH
ncbi:MAG: HD-like signal output (HDOD) protein [Gammaproteobacteria bacterium]|jgi:HD-like signal output (HDOD) protein